MNRCRRRKVDTLLTIEMITKEALRVLECNLVFSGDFQSEDPDSLRRLVNKAQSDGWFLRQKRLREAQHE